MSIKLDANTSAYQQLAQINEMARSSSKTIAGNLGMINGRVVKFNTHFSERLFSQTTNDMLAASNAMRDTLKDLIGKVLVDDQAKIAELCRMIDGKGNQTLLERKVVAKVIEKAQTYAGVGMGVTAEALRLQSSQGIKTDFTSAQIEVRRDELRPQLKSMMYALSSSIGFDANKGGVRLNYMMRAEAFINRYLENTITTPNATVNDSFVKLALGILWRMGKQETDPTSRAYLPPRSVLNPAEQQEKGLSDKDYLSLAVNANDEAATCLLTFARGHEELAMRLLAELPVTVPSMTTFLLSNPAFVAKMEANPAALTRTAMYEAAVGRKAPQGLETMSGLQFANCIENDVVENLRRNPEDGDDPTAPNVHYARLAGTTGVVMGGDLAEKIRNPPREGLHVTLQDLRAKGSGFEAARAIRSGMKEVRKELLYDLERDQTKITVGEKVIDFKTIQFKKQDIGMVAEESAQPLFDELDKMGMTEEQKLVSLMLCTQGGVTLTLAFPIGGTANHHDIPERTITKDPVTNAITVKIATTPENPNAPALSYSVTIQPDGTNEIVALDYTVPAQA